MKKPLMCPKKQDIWVVFCIYSMTLNVLYRYFLTPSKLAGMQYSQLNLFPPKCRINVRLCLKRIKLLKHSISLEREREKPEAEMSCLVSTFMGKNNDILFQLTSFCKFKSKYDPTAKHYCWMKSVISHNFLATSLNFWMGYCCSLLFSYFPRLWTFINSLEKCWPRHQQDFLWDIGSCVTWGNRQDSDF